MVLLSQTGPQLGVSKNRLPVAALPLSLPLLRQMLSEQGHRFMRGEIAPKDGGGGRAATWPKCDSGVGGTAPYMIVFLQQQQVHPLLSGSGSSMCGPWRVMGPGQVEAALGQYLRSAAAAGGQNILDQHDRIEVATLASPMAGLNVRHGTPIAASSSGAMTAAGKPRLSTVPAVRPPVPYCPPPALRAALMLPCWMAVQGAFPLNGTYFQVGFLVAP